MFQRQGYLFKHYWDNDLNDLKCRSIEANTLWIECGRPRSGPVYQQWRSAKYTYKRAVRSKQREANLYVSNELNDCLLNKDANQFWKVWNSKMNMKTCLPQCIDGVTDSSDVAKIFAGSFEEACQPNSDSQYNRLRDTFNQRILNYSPVNNLNCSITIELVEKCISKLKNRKAAGIDRIEAEHLKFAHPIVCVKLCDLFNKILSFGKVPQLFGSGLIIPVPKDKSGELCNSKNYRGITLSPVISKLLELCLLDIYGDYLYSNNLQFGFKSKLSCNHAPYVMRKTTEYFVSRGSTVNICSLDIHKAFDKVNHFGLFIKLMDRNVPRNFLLILINWYGLCSGIVKWNSCISQLFYLRCGVRQGGVLSPVLFAVYVNDLICKLVQSNSGCYIGGVNVCCLFYADDMVLLTGSVCKLQKMLNICSVEMEFLDLKFNVGKCHLLRVGRCFQNECGSVSINGTAVGRVDSLSYLGVNILAGKHWRIDITTRRQKFFRSVNNICRKSALFSEPVLHHLISSYCKPVLVYNIAGANCNKTILNKIEHAWNCALYKVYGVSGTNLNIVLAYTGQLPILLDMVLYKFKFLLSCSSSDNVIIRQLYEILGVDDFVSCCNELELDVRCRGGLSVGRVRQGVLDSFCGRTLINC